MELFSVYAREAIRVIASTTVEPDILLAQLARAACSGHRYTGDGLHTHLIVDQTAPKLHADFWEMEDMPMGDTVHSNVRHGIGIILWLKNGYMDCLESCTYEGEWPQDETLIQIRH